MQCLPCGGDHTALLRSAFAHVYKSCIALAGNNGQDVDILHLISQHFRIHAVSVLIHAQTQTTAYFLPLLRGAVAVLQGAGFVDGLQKQTEAVLYDRPRKADIAYFTGKTIS